MAPAANDPRQDLDAHVNGRWRARVRIPARRGHVDTFSRLADRSQAEQQRLCLECTALPAASRTPAERLIADLWTSACDDTAIEAAGLTPLADALATIDTLQTASGIVRWLHAQQADGIALVQQPIVEPDPHHPRRAVLTLLPAGMGLPDARDYRPRDDHARARRQGYRHYLAQTLRISGMSAAAADTGADQVLALETRLARHAPTPPQRADQPRRRQRGLPLPDAHALTPLLDWPGLLTVLGAARVDTLRLPWPHWHQGLAHALEAVPIATWRLYLRHHLLDRYAPWLHRRLRHAHHRFHHGVLRGHARPPARHQRALALVNEAAGDSLSTLFAQRHCPATTRDQAMALAEALRHTFVQRIDACDWLSRSGRMAAANKLRRLRILIGSAPGSESDRSLPASRPDRLFENARAARRHRLRRQLAQLTDGPDTGNGLPTAQTANARYDPHHNRILIPAALLRPPLFAIEAEPARNLGGLGAIIAHELTHALDDQGSRFDADGRLDARFWSASDRRAFRTQVQGLHDHLTRTGRAAPTPFDAGMTLSEQLADLGGVAIALATLEARLVDQSPAARRRALRQFFAGWARVWRFAARATEIAYRQQHSRHPPHGWRANFAPRHQHAFADAFGSRPGDGMWLPANQRLRIW